MSSTGYSMPTNSPTYHNSSLDLTEEISQTDKFVALIQRFGRWPAYLTGDPIDSRGNELFIPIVVLGPLALITTCLRLWVRTKVVKSIGWDDYTMIVALASTIVFNALYAWAVKGGGLGRYEIDVPLEMWPALFKATFINPIIYHVCCIFLKASVCLFLLRIATQKFYRRILWGTLIFSSVTLVGFMTVTACQCDYLDLFYGKKTSSWCVSPRIVEKASFGSAAVNISTDFLVVIIPIPMLWNVSISRRKKLLIRVILSLGLFASFATVIRLIYILVWPPYGNFTRRIEFEIWSVIELNVGIAVANIPALAPLIKGFLERKLTKGSGEDSPPGSDRFKFGRIKLPGQRGFRTLKSLRNWQVTLGTGFWATSRGREDSVDSGGSSGEWSWGSESTAGGGGGRKMHQKRGSDLTSFTDAGDMEKGWRKGSDASLGLSRTDTVDEKYAYGFENSYSPHTGTGTDTMSSLGSHGGSTLVNVPSRARDTRGEGQRDVMQIRKTVGVSVVEEEWPQRQEGSSLPASSRENIVEEEPVRPKRVRSYIRRI